MINAYKILVGNLEGKKALVRPWRRWQGNLKMDFKEIGCENVNYNHLVQDSIKWRALVNTLMNLLVS
jgi:hypothetical protein